jgi:glycosyltransferase involved in cell wall biosynthesis
VPSLGGEVFGLVVAENMARGLPVVASDLGAFTEVLADTGVVFRTGDAEKLAAALVGLLDDPSFAATLGRRARQRVKSVYRLEGMIEAHASLYSRFLK